MFNSLATNPSVAAIGLSIIATKLNTGLNTSIRFNAIAWIEFLISVIGPVIPLASITSARDKSFIASCVFKVPSANPLSASCFEIIFVISLTSIPIAAAIALRASGLICSHSAAEPTCSNSAAPIPFKSPS